MMTHTVTKSAKHSVKDSTTQFRLKVPRELYNDLLVQAKINFRSIAEEVAQQLQVSVVCNDEVMSEDRLLRLIYSKSLAHPA